MFSLCSRPIVLNGPNKQDPVVHNYIPTKELPSLGWGLSSRAVASFPFALSKTKPVPTPFPKITSFPKKILSNQTKRLYKD